MQRWLILTAAVAAGWTGCGAGFDQGKCAGVKCPEGHVCGAATGRCIPIAGVMDLAMPDLATPIEPPDLATPTMVDLAGSDFAGGGGADLAGGAKDAGPGRDASRDGAVDLAMGVPACKTPTPLVFVNDGAAVNGDTANGTPAATGSCRSASGPELLYSFTLNSARLVTATVTPDVGSSPSYEPALYIRNFCTSSLEKYEVACHAAGVSKKAASITAVLPAGDYYLFVDGTAGTKGRFALTVTQAPPPQPPANDACAAPQKLTFNNNVATASYDTFAAKGDSEGDCGGFGPDVVFSFTTLQAQKITVSAKPDAMAPMYRPVVYLRRDTGMGCAKAVEASCDVSPAEGVLASAVAPNAPAGTYYAWADGYAGTRGKGNLTVTLDAPVPPPKNDTCAGAIAIALMGTAMGDTTLAGDDLGSKLPVVCDVDMQGNLPGRDVVYVYTAAANGMVSANLKSDGSWDPALWVMPAMCMASGANCTKASDEIGNAKAEDVTFAATAGTAYYIVVDAWDGSEAGPFTLSVQ